MAVYTTKQYIAKLNASLPEIEKSAGRNVAATHALHMQEMFVDGKGANGKIGSYSTKPLYVNTKTSPKTLEGKGKTGKTQFKNGKKHKSTYFSGGYKEFRKSQGRRNDTVDMSLSGDLMRDMSNSLHQTTKNVWVTGPKRSHNADKLSGLIDRYGSHIVKLPRDLHEKLTNACLADLVKIVTK